LGEEKRGETLEVGIAVGSGARINLSFRRDPERGIQLREMVFSDGGTEIKLRPEMTSSELKADLPPAARQFVTFVAGLEGGGSRRKSQAENLLTFKVRRSRCFLELLASPKPHGAKLRLGFSRGTDLKIGFPTEKVGNEIVRLIHLPGLRGNPERTYAVTGVGGTFPGTFEKYVASVITKWQAEDKGKLEALNHALDRLGLTYRIIAKPVTETRVELRVGRLVHGKREGDDDLVSIADVGFGVSQTLPVLVALLVAEPGQAVYLEQPEIHLHPKAQSQMAGLLADAAVRGVRVIAETHSSILLRSVQTLVATGKLSPQLVKLHWFTRKPEDGSTEIHSADLDKQGAFGDWPEDFDEVALETEKQYLDAAETGHRS
jgi:hypothetical protein